MAQTIIAENQTAGAVTLEDIGIVVPGSGSSTLTDTLFVYEIQASADLETAIVNDDILINLGSGTLSKAESLNVVESPSSSENTTANTPTTDEKAALVGTDGSPSAANRYVTNSDPRLVPGNIDHTALSNLTPGDGGHSELALLPGRLGGQTLNGGTAVSQELVLRGTTNANLGLIRAQSPIVWDDTQAANALSPYFADAQPTQTITASFVGGGYNASPTINFSNPTFIWEGMRISPVIQSDVAPGFAAFTLLQALPVLTAGSGATFNPLNALTLNVGVVMENTFTGTRTATNNNAINFAPQTRATVSGGTMTVTNQRGIRVQPTYSTVLGSTVNMGTVVGVSCGEPVAALFQPDLGTENLTAYYGIDFENITFTSSGDKVVVRSAMTDATDRFFLQNNGGARSDFGGGSLLDCGQVQIDSDSVGVMLGEGQDLEVLFDGTQLVFNTPAAGDQLRYRNFDALNYWRVDSDAASQGLQLDFEALSIGATAADPTSNWFTIVSPPDQRQPGGVGEYSDLLFTAGGDLDVNGLALTDVAAYKSNALTVALNGGTIADITNLRIQGMTTSGIGTALTSALMVTGRTVLEGSLNMAPITAAQLTADVNDYQGHGIGNSQRGVLRVSADATRTITGFDVGISRVNDTIEVINIGAFSVVLAHEDAGSAAANRILVSTGLDLILGANETARLWYDDTSARWRVIGVGGGIDSVREYDAVVPDDFVLPSAAFAAGALSVFVKTGTYVETANIVVPNGGRLLGEEQGVTIDLSGGFSVNCDGGTVAETTGTIAVTNGSAAVVGTGTTFTNLAAGNYLAIGDVFYEILSITDATNLTLVETWNGSTQTGLAMFGLPMFRDLLMENITLADATGVGLFLRAISNSRFTNVFVRNCGANMSLVNSGTLRFDGCLSEFSTASGATVSSCRSVRFDQCYFNGNGLDGVNLNSGTIGVTFEGCSLDGNGGDGVDAIDTVTDVLLYACSSKHNGGKGVNTEATTARCVVSNSVLQFNGSDGVDFDGSENCIADCKIGNNGGHGVQAGDDGQIVGNTIHDNTLNGINMAGDDNTIVDDNRIEANTLNGIDIPVGATDIIVTNNQIISNVGIGLNIAATTGTRYSDNVMQGNGTDLVDAGTSIGMLENDGSVKMGSGASTLDTAFDVTIHSPDTASGLKIRAGDSQDDIALRITDAGEALQILDVHADDGEVVFGAEFPATVTANGVAFGQDNQWAATPIERAGFNTQNGLYWIGGQRANGTFNVYDAAGGQTFTGTAITVNLDTSFDTGDDGPGNATDLFTLAADQVTVNVTGTYLLLATCGTDVSVGAGGAARSESQGFVEVDTGGGFGELGGTRMLMYNRQATQGNAQGTAVRALDITAGDIFRLRVVRVSGAVSTLVTVANASSLTFVRLS